MRSLALNTLAVSPRSLSKHGTPRGCREKDLAMCPEQRAFDRLGVVAVLIRQERFLVIRRSRLVVAPRAYCFPGGAIEPGESEEEALVRELREELGVAVRPVRHLWRSTTPWNVRLSWWLAELDPQAEPQPNPAEVESVHWYTSAEMRQLPELLESNRHFLDAVARQEIELAVEGA